ncbi:hypothetical protein E1B28_003959 [Marasmius oreades]|uniref:Uncharacterized protein n=1 Tax=Marasmius oreades TaxID=181124 RepID=A0A9P7UXQ5_9AGAR|nr:uncharacterized protein E1B28_003959 [Marasmius oreades]KAG7096530.1 hypothetical protein E1B28_003959 [Marasmius oreades]
MNSTHEQTHSNIKRPCHESSIFSRIRTFNHHAFRSLGSFFSSSDNVDASQQHFDKDDDDIHDQYVWDPASGLTSSEYNPTHYDCHDHPTSFPSSCLYQSQNADSLNSSDIHTPTPSRPITPRDHVKHVCSFGPDQQSIVPQSSLQPTPMPSNLDIWEYYEDSISLDNLPKARAPMISAPSSSTIKTNTSDYSDIDETPPLSPDVADLAHSFSLIGNFDEARRDLDLVGRLSNIREGKKPERPICYDTLIDDLGSNSTNASQLDETEGWYGLAYTLALSVKERRASETYSYDESPGEFSKSRESWAALHSFLEDEDYYEWKNWHQRLDRDDERQKNRRGLEFEARSKDMAWIYLAEMQTRDVYYWQLGAYGVVGDDVKEQLSSLNEHRKVVTLLSSTNVV